MRRVVVAERNLSAAPPAGHTASIREVENLTGMDMLPNLSADDLKQAVPAELWPRN